MSKHAIIDADPFIYQVGYSCASYGEFDGDVLSITNLDNAFSKIDAFIAEAVDACECNTYTAALSDLTSNWRKPIYPGYKAQRKASSRPGCFGQLRAHVSKNHRAVTWPRCEADDVCGVLLTEAEFGSSICISIDKDLLTIPGLHFNPNKPELGIRAVDRRAGFLNHMAQTLTGDSTDNYPGCPGVGPVSAAKVLILGLVEEEAATWRRVVQAYVMKGLTESDALTMARISRILQKNDYNRKTGEIRLWTAPIESAPLVSRSKPSSRKTPAPADPSTPAPSATRRRAKGGTTSSARSASSVSRNSAKGGRSSTARATGRRASR